MSIKVKIEELEAQLEDIKEDIALFSTLAPNQGISAMELRDELEYLEDKERHVKMLLNRARMVLRGENGSLLK